MTADQKRVAAITVAVLAVLAGMILFAPARQRVAPQPRAAYVAIEVAGQDVARVGVPVELDAGTPFTLRAVLEAKDWRGRTVYFTEASRLEIDGREIASEALEPWDDGFLSAKVLWFSVEGAHRYREVASDEALTVAFREVFRPDWPQAWSVPGSVQPSFAEAEAAGLGLAWPEVGTLRYQVRVELFGPESRFVARTRFGSAGADRLPSEVDTFPVVTIAAPGHLAAASSRLGLTQLEPLGELGPEGRDRLFEWTRRRIAVSRKPLLQLHVQAAGLGWEDLVWEPVELDGSVEWGEPGDLIQAGSRVVVAFEDRGEPGRLDGEDLVLDFDKGQHLIYLKTIFRGEGTVERAELAPAR
jgi:hypothetical protein